MFSLEKKAVPQTHQTIQARKEDSLMVEEQKPVTGLIVRLFREQGEVRPQFESEANQTSRE